MFDSRKIFSGKEKNYDKNRPAYPMQLISFLYDTIGFKDSSVIADIGSGTGIFLKQIADRGSTVFCVEPNNDMRQIARAKLAEYSNVQFTDGDCENTRLVDNSVDFIAAAQAFHWFDVDRFKNESRRILKPTGKAVLIWNRRDEGFVVNLEVAAIMKKYCPRFHGFGGGVKDDVAIRRYFSQGYEIFECENNIAYDRNSFIGRNLSGSYAIQQGDAEYEFFINELDELFDRFSSQGQMIVPHKTVAYWGAVE